MNERTLTSSRALRRFLLLGVSAAGVLTAIALAAATVGSTPATAAPWSDNTQGHHGHERMAMHAEMVTEWLLGKVDASDEQEAEVKQIVGREIKDLASLRAETEASGLRGGAEWLELLRAETVDRDAVEVLRAEHLARADEVSGRIADALIEVAAVLTVEQRQELADLAEKHHERRPSRRHRWHRGH